MTVISNFICDYNTRHNLNYVSPELFTRNCWLIMCFSTPFIINSPTGLIYGETRDLVINRPYYHYWHTNQLNAKTGFVNSWFHYNCEDSYKMMDEYSLAPDVLYHIVDPSVFSADLSELEKEMKCNQKYSDTMVLLLFKKLLINLTRQNDIYNIQHEISNHYISVMTELRLEMLENYFYEYTLKELAKKVNLSCDYFSAVYKRIFGISPIKELQMKRLETARKLLVSSDCTIKEISEMCGYRDANYFSRLFKKNTGYSPNNLR